MIQPSAPARRGVPRGIDRTGPALLSYGFRPFFLGAGAFAALAMIGWIGALAGAWEIGGDTYGPLQWHAHEMIFGYAVAALAGFMLTAIPNWTGRLPVSGLPLVSLVLLWLAGRIGMANPELFGFYPAVLVDIAFLPALAFVAGREIVAGRNWKNLKILLALGALSLVNIGFHMSVVFDADPQMAFRAGVGVLVALISLVGGRIIPSFTRNWLARRGAARLPRPFGRFDIAAITALVLALAAWAVVPEGPATAALAIVAALFQSWRLAGWCGFAVRKEPLLAVLHIAHSFIPIGLIAVAASALGWLSGISALHLLTVGVIGLTTLGVMARATRGHTGHPLAASPVSAAAFLLLLVAAVLRPFAELVPSGYHLLLDVSGGAWILAFALFCIEYAPMLVRPKNSGDR